MTQNVRVLHLIVGLGGGGSERWLRDVVRCAPPGVEHWVQTIYPRRVIGFQYAGDLDELNAYRSGPEVLPWSTATVNRVRAAWTTAPPWLRAGARRVAAAGALARGVVTVRRFKPDVIHSHTLPDFTVGLSLARYGRIPLVHTVPCLFSQMVADGYGSMPALYGRVHPAVARFSAGENREELMSLGIPAEKILYDLGGVDLEAVNAAQARRDVHATQVRQSLDLPPECKIALAVGRLDSYKGHVAGLRVLRELAKLVPDCHLVILGDGPERATLDAAAADLGVTDRVHFEGFRSDPRPYYAASDVYFRTSLLEMENLSLYAALAHGLPVVGFDTGVGRDLILEADCGAQVPAGDVAGFARAAGDLLRMPDRGRSVGDRGRAYAGEHLDLRASVALLSRVYLELAGRQGAQHAAGSHG